MEFEQFAEIVDICVKSGALIVAIFAVINWFDSVRQRKKSIVLSRQNSQKY